MPKGVPLAPRRAPSRGARRGSPARVRGLRGRRSRPAQYGAGHGRDLGRGTYELVEEKRDGGLTVRLHGERLDGVWTLVPAQLDGDPKNWLLLRKDAGADAARGATRRCSRRSPETLPPGEGWVYEPKWDGFRAIVDGLGRRGDAHEPERQRPHRALPRRRARGRRTRSARPTPSSTARSARSTSAGRSRFSLLQEGAGTLVLVAVRPARARRRAARRRAARGAATRRLEAARSTRSVEAVRRLAAVRRRRGAPRGRAGAGARGRRREARRLALPPGPAHAGLAEGEAAADAGGRRSPGTRAGRAGARGFGALVLGRARGGRAALGRERRHRASPTARSSGCSALLAPARARRRRRSPRSPKMPRVRRCRRRLGRAGARRRGRVRRVDARRPPARAGRTSGCARTRRPPTCAASARRSPPEITRGRRELRLSNLDKPFWPEEGITKGDLIAYYRDVAAVLVPHLRGRPFTMKRYPDGWQGKHFFQKHAPSHMPDWIERGAVPGLDARGRAADDRLRARRTTSSRSCGWSNMGCIDLHTWASRVDRPSGPTG